VVEQLIVEHPTLPWAKPMDVVEHDDRPLLQTF